MFCAWCGAPVTTVSYAPCTSCGRPTNGVLTAPPPAAVPRGGGSVAIIVVVIVVVGLFVVAIIGILSAIAVPNLLTAMQRSKQKRTMADMRMLSTALEAYQADNNAYPNLGTYDLGSVLTPKYVHSVPAVDGWGHPYRYSCVADQQGRCTAYVLGSSGKDGRFTHDSAKEYLDAPLGGTSTFDADLIVSNGRFTDYPEGMQH